MSPEDLEIDSTRLDRVRARIEADVAAERYDGAVVLVARRGEVALHEAIGWADRDAGRTQRLDDVFHLFSVTKTFTAIAVLQCVDRGDLQLHTPVADLIPEFAAKGKRRVTIAQLLTHRAGLPVDLPPISLASFGNTTDVALAVADQALIATPGGAVCYSPIGGFAVLAEVVRRLDTAGRAFRTILEDEVFAPLGMDDTSLVKRPDLADRLCPAVVRDPAPGIIAPAAIESINTMHGETFEMPGGGAIGTAVDLFRFGETLRRGGALSGRRVLSGSLLDVALRNHTGEAINHIFDGMCEARGWDPFPANLGLGFFLRGQSMFPMPFGATTSASAFGGLGAGSTMFWVDPERELTFVCLTTGVLEDSNNFERMARLSDLALAAIVR